MTPSLGTQIFWMISIGMVIGYIGFFVYRKGIDMIPSVIMSTIGSVASGLIAIYFAFGVPLGFAWLGGIIVLFLTNVFQQDDHTELEGTASS
ncbi:MAG: hypothetical protein PVH63_03940 [Balneolaceae bacterium]|jgi:hypothetical protein